MGRLLQRSGPRPFHPGIFERSLPFYPLPSLPCPPDGSFCPLHAYGHPTLEYESGVSCSCWWGEIGRRHYPRGGASTARRCSVTLQHHQIRCRPVDNTHPFTEFFLGPGNNELVTPGASAYRFES